MITQNIIGFDLSAKSNKTIYAFDPANMKQLPEAFVVATAEEVDLLAGEFRERINALAKLG